MTSAPASASPFRHRGVVEGFYGLLSREALPAQASYGPRRVLYPQLVSMRDDAMGFGSDPLLYVGACLADDLVALAERVALERYGS